jgi:hypothetical protein
LQLEAVSDQAHIAQLAVDEIDGRIFRHFFDRHQTAPQLELKSPNAGLFKSSVPLVGTACHYAAMG